MLFLLMRSFLLDSSWWRVARGAFVVRSSSAGFSLFAGYSTENSKCRAQDDIPFRHFFRSARSGHLLRSGTGCWPLFPGSY